jgi:hypothetical protein
MLSDSLFGAEQQTDGGREGGRERARERERERERETSIRSTVIAGKLALACCKQQTEGLKVRGFAKVDNGFGYEKWFTGVMMMIILWEYRFCVGARG